MTTEPRRWTEECTPAEAPAAELLATVRSEAYVDERRLGAIRARLELTLAAQGGEPRRSAGLRRPRALMLVAAFVATGAAALTLSTQRSSPVPSPSVSTPQPPRVPKGGGAHSVEPTPVQALPAPSANPSVDVPLRAFVPAGSATQAKRPPDSGAPDHERELFAQAVAALRREGAPARALALLDEYRGEFPRGRFAQEAELTRIDALVALGRTGEALKRLERLPLDRMPQSNRLRQLRDQLRGKR